MFTGIIEEIGTISLVLDRDGGRRIRISCAFADSLRVDESVSVNGVCLTVTDLGDGWFEAFAIEETLDKSSLGSLASGDRVNLERAMSATGRLDGHIVQGHVDGIGTIEDIVSLEGSTIVVVGFDPEFRNYLIPKGSITLDGISLTVAEVDDRALKVAIIPHTFENTVVGDWSRGRLVNIEFDMIGKYVVGYLARTNQAGS